MTRAPSARMFPNVVTVTRRTWTNSGGERTVDTETTAELFASVQPMSAQRRSMHQVEAGVLALSVYFAADPQLEVGDGITWGSRTLSVLASGLDQAGRGAAWAVDCQEVR